MKKLIIPMLLCVLLVGCNKQSTKIELKGNPTTGYEWTCYLENKTVAEVSSDYKEVNPNNLEGAGGIYTFTLKPINEGTTSLICNYKRLWETTEDEITKIYEVNVDSKMNITYEEK